MSTKRVGSHISSLDSALHDGCEKMHDISQSYACFRLRGEEVLSSRGGQGDPWIEAASIPKLAYISLIQTRDTYLAWS